MSAGSRSLDGARLSLYMKWPDEGLPPAAAEQQGCAAAAGRPAAGPGSSPGRRATQPMGETLVIVESPAKARTVERYLGKGFRVIASVGHLKDLPKNELGVDIDDDFAPEYVPIKGKGKVLTQIRELARQADRVLLAPDPDREGEAIAWHIKEDIERYNKEIQRILIHEITQRGVAEALAHPLPLNQRRFESQQARRILDRLVGYQISPLLWDKVRRGLSAGRVQSVAVRLVVDREQEIQCFVPEEFWTVTAQLLTGEGKRFKARLQRWKGKKQRIPDGEEAARVRAALQGVCWLVAEVEAKEQKKSPPPPFTTAKLQQEAARLLRFTAKRTMALAQTLYQGVELGPEGPVGLITYMRTDSTRLSEDALSMARQAIQGRFGEEFLPAEPRRFRSKKGAQDAHEAIRPTSTERTPESLEPFLEREQLKLYRLIYNRFLASQMSEARHERTQVIIQAGEVEFRATGQVL
ncbi:MAG: type I DNA topoisomerase, partial [Deltaproteobacteria bacterium]|nr:type I DNA topoisomerase [Deltaproteobacteria bacterium]